MTAPLLVTAEPDFPVSVLRVAGPLGFATVGDLRHAGQKAIADRPELLVLDVSKVVAVDDITLTAFPMLARHGAEGGTDVMLAAPGPALAERLDALGVARQIPVLPSVADAVAAHARQPGPRRLDARLEPHPGATGEARDLVDRACAQWRLPHLADTAALVVTELVANAVQHAGTPMKVSVAVRRHHLHVAVCDGSLRPLRRDSDDEDGEPGRGLLIVEGVAAAWGCMYTGDGKVVWATLRLRPKG